MNELRPEHWKQKTYLNLRYGIISWRAYQEGKSKLNSEEAERSIMNNISRGAIFTMNSYAKVASQEEVQQAASFLHTISASDSFETVQNEWKTLDNEFEAFLLNLYTYTDPSTIIQGLISCFKESRCEAAKIYVSTLLDKIERAFKKDSIDFRKRIHPLNEEVKVQLEALKNPLLDEWIQFPVYLKNRLYDTDSLRSHAFVKTNHEPQNKGRILPLRDPFSNVEERPWI